MKRSTTAHMPPIKQRAEINIQTYCNFCMYKHIQSDVVHHNPASLFYLLLRKVLGIHLCIFSLKMLIINVNIVTFRKIIFFSTLLIYQFILRKKELCVCVFRLQLNLFYVTSIYFVVTNKNCQEAQIAVGMACNINNSAYFCYTAHPIHSYI